MTAMVTVAATAEGGDWRCSVEVVEDGGRSRHTVRLRSADLHRWGHPGETPDQFVARAFEFLLAREPAGQILGTFEVADITRYFPEFDREMRG